VRPQAGRGCGAQGGVHKSAAHHCAHVLPNRHSIDLPSHHRGATPGAPWFRRQPWHGPSPAPPTPSPTAAAREAAGTGGVPGAQRGPQGSTAGIPRERGSPCHSPSVWGLLRCRGRRPPHVMGGHAQHMPHSAHRQSATPVLPAAAPGFHCRPQAVAEEEPDLKWVSDLVQDF